jgi:rhodanese-related sulfurtransferase
MAQSRSEWIFVFGKGVVLVSFEVEGWELVMGAVKPLCILDLRTDLQFNRGHLSNARNLPYNQFQADAEEASAGHEWVLLVDDGGARAAEMAVWLRVRGVDARYLVGGMSAWRGGLEAE